MELHQLTTFESVVALGSFTRAAESLCLTQPAVTRQIAALEAELKTRLFDRLGRTVRMTTAGETLHRYAAAIVRMEREARQAVADVDAGAAGRIIVGASNTLATYVLPELLRCFRAEYPQVEVAVHTGVSADVLEMVRANDVDLGLVTAEVSDSGLSAHTLGEFATVVVVPPGHPLAGLQSVTAAELADHPLILMESGTSLRTYVDRVLSAAGVQEQVAIEMDNVEAIKRMIEAGLGISMLPEVAVGAEISAGRLVSLKLAGIPQANRQIRQVYRRDKYLTVAVRAFIEIAGLTANERTEATR